MQNNDLTTFLLTCFNPNCHPPHRFEKSKPNLGEVQFTNLNEGVCVQGFPILAYSINISFVTGETVMIQI